MIRIYLLLFIITWPPYSAFARRRVWRKVEAISGREAILPCEVGQLDAERDMIYVVLWYLNGRKEPIYSYDNRPRGLQAAEDRHIIQSTELKNRVSFRPGAIPALHIKPVFNTDQANYTCRVDFRIANSRSTHFSLRVVVPPTKPILKIGGKPLYDHNIGPLQEGHSFRISCIVSRGQPSPEVLWIKDDEVIDSRSETQTPFRTVNHLIIPSLPRTYHHAKLICKAFNNNVTAPVITSININMHLRPSIVFLRSPPKQLKIGARYKISCVTAGSRPNPNITWTLGNIASVIPITPITEEHSENSSVSIVEIIAVRRYHGQRLTCLVVNPIFPKAILSDNINLNVTYPPIAALELGRGVSSVVKEGADVYFNCMIDSNPPTYRTRWYHEKNLLNHSPMLNGIVISGQSLALRRISRAQAGKYSCSASNIEGDAMSSPLTIKVSYAPICSIPEPHTKVTASAIGQQLNVTCDVVASPSDVKFSWVFNNSVTSERVPGNQVILDTDGRSTVQFKARSAQDYGTLQCWAENIVGRMNSPCLFHVLPAGRPDPPINCSVANKTYDSLVVFCKPGFNGGLVQIFDAKIFEAVTRRSQLNVTSTLSQFVLRGLTPGIDYVITVRSRNIMGESDPIRLEAFTYKMAENRMRDNQGGGMTDSNHSGSFSISNSPEGSITFALVAGIGLLLLALTVLGFLVKNIVSKRGLPGSRRVQFQGATTTELADEFIKLKVQGSNRGSFETRESKTASFMDDHDL